MDYIPANSYETKITNCVNYGTITNFGSCSNSAIFGGIIGEIYTPVESYKSYVYNCLNYGTILNDGTLSKYYLAGITGDTYGTSIINCVSIGKVISLKGGFVGSITGTSWYYDTTYTHCYWTTNTECDKYYGLETGRLVDSGIYLETSINASNTDEINNYAVENKWNKWAYNKNNITITFVVFDGEGFSFDSQLILLPKPVRRGYSFSFWCVNQNLSNGCNKKYNREITPEFTSETILYAQWIPNKCTVTLNVNERTKLLIMKMLSI